MMRHLPPTTTPLSQADLRQGLNLFSSSYARLQTALAGYLGVPVLGLASSGRTALYLLLKSLVQTSELAGRGEVLLPAYTCPSLVKVTLDAGLRPRLIDISAKTLAFEMDQLEAALSQQTLAVICVHPFGLPQAMDSIIKLVRQVGALVIEDAAQALGARFGGRLVGTRGDFGLYSLGPGKPISTGGGGILCAQTEQAALIRAVKRTWQDLPASSVLASGWALTRLGLLKLAFHPVGWWLATRLNLHRVGEHEASWGYKLSALTAAQASVGLRLLERLDAVNEHRRLKAEQLVAGLQPLDFVHIPQISASAAPIYLRLPVMVASEERREQLFQRLWAAGIGVGRMYGRPLTAFFPQLQDQPYPGANRAAQQLLTLPTHHYLTQSDIQRITQIFHAC